MPPNWLRAAHPGGYPQGSPPLAQELVLDPLQMAGASFATGESMSVSGGYRWAPFDVPWTPDWA